MGEKKKSIEPMADQVVLERLSGQKKTDGGILIPESSQKWINEYRVVEVGSDIVSMVVGDVVVCADIAECPEVSMGPEKVYMIVKYDKIVARIIER
jgi:co-chaperonin GroES (HSP10)